MKNRINKIWVVSGGLGLILVAFWVKSSISSPYLLLHNTNCFAFLPPLWILGIFWYGMYFLLGGAAGHIFSLEHLPPITDVKRFKGGMFFVLTVMFSLAWYLLLFGAEAFFISWIMCLLASLFSFLCVFNWFFVHKNCAFMAGLFFIGYLILSVLHLAAMLQL